MVNTGRWVGFILRFLLRAMGQTRFYCKILFYFAVKVKVIEFAIQTAQKSSFVVWRSIERPLKSVFQVAEHYFKKNAILFTCNTLAQPISTICAIANSNDSESLVICGNLTYSQIKSCCPLAPPACRITLPLGHLALRNLSSTFNKQFLCHT